ncbi:MAG: class I SAM-dependent methyltransferase [Usitatibacter sp.]
MSAAAAEVACRAARAPLDEILDGLRCGAVGEALDALVAHLAEMRGRSSPESWLHYMGVARAHPLREFVHRDPFAFRCYAKPRGYPANATAQDYVLRVRERAHRSADALGDLHHYTTHGQTARALRFRRDYFAREIDAAAARAQRPIRVFAAGSGYLRECDRVEGFSSGRIAKIVAFDVDAENLDGLRRDYPQLPVVAHHGSVRQLAEGKHLFGDMDLVYCAGLMESLPQAEAQALARALFAMLAPGGTLIVTHFLPGLEEAAFLETFLDWKMIYRGDAEILELVRGLPLDSVSDRSYAENPESTLGIAAVTRR